MIDNVLVPKHELLPAEEAKKVFEKYKATPEEFPKIKRNDPAIAALAAKEGALIRIHRNTLGIGTSFYYRVVL